MRYFFADSLMQGEVDVSGRPLEKRTATSLMIDTDNSALLDPEKNVETEEELMHRTVS